MRGWRVGVRAGELPDAVGRDVSGHLLFELLHDHAESLEVRVPCADDHQEVDVSRSLFTPEKAAVPDDPVDPHRQVGGAASLAKGHEALEEDGLPFRGS
jgi:hypothetical protein